VIGRQLCATLLDYQPLELSLLDKDAVRLDEAMRILIAKSPQTNVRRLHLDITIAAEVAQAYESAAPDIVFHLASERSPVLAETKVREAILTNILGSKELAAQAARRGVDRFIYSSTGNVVLFMMNAFIPPPSATRKR